MSSPKSIFDQIIESKNIQDVSTFDPDAIISDLLKELTPKEREVISRRFGLGDNTMQTLEEIGKTFQITRERIRQIQSAAVRKIKALAEAKQQLNVLQHTVTRLLHENGGILENNALHEQLLSHLGNAPRHQQATSFVLSQLLTEHVERVRPSDHVHPGWKLRSVDLGFIEQALNVLSEIIAQEKQLFAVEELIRRFRAHKFFEENRERFLPLGATVVQSEDEAYDKVLRAYLTISRGIEQNILGDWGLTEWATIRPRRMGDKIYLVMLQIGKPLHFTEITSKINEADFDHKVAYPATIHNELILDERYVLVGRGIYALREWGYQPGTVSDVVVQVLGEAGRPMTRDEVVAEVAKRRLVRKSTIHLALMNRQHILKSGDRYQLKPAA